MSVTAIEPGDDTRPYDTTDPTWTDTWAWFAIDTRTRSAFLVHCLAKPFSGKTRHSLLLCRDGKTWRTDAITEEPMHSPLLTLDVDGWTSATLSSAAEDFEMVARPWNDPVDFGQMNADEKNLKLGHFEAGILATGRIGDIAFDGMGFRDRGYGVRTALGLGWHTVIVVGSPTADIYATCSLGLTSAWPTNQGAQFRIGHIHRDGVTRLLEPDEMAVRRNPDGTVAGVRLADLVVETTDEYGVGHYSAQWHPDDPMTPAERSVYGTTCHFGAGRTADGVEVMMLHEEAVLSHP
jgi:hypothetical protein